MNQACELGDIDELDAYSLLPSAGGDVSKAPPQVTLVEVVEVETAIKLGGSLVDDR